MTLSEVNVVSEPEVASEHAQHSIHQCSIVLTITMIGPPVRHTQDPTHFQPQQEVNVDICFWSLISRELQGVNK